VLEGPPIAPPLVGDLFIENWEGSVLGELFEVTYTTMPPGGEGTLTGNEIAAIFAYMLSLSGAPAGGADLPNDVAGLTPILIQAGE
jgi:mono/diheme cytochrome c family protein